MSKAALRMVFPVVVLFAYSVDSQALCIGQQLAGMRQALITTIQHAEAGQSEYQYRLAQMYRDGQCVTRNKEQAAYWYRQAALNGHVEAQYRIAVIYLNGYGVQADNALAEYWLEEAVKSGHAGAKGFLAYLKEVGFDDEYC